MPLKDFSKIYVKGKKFAVQISDEGKFFAEFEDDQVSGRITKTAHRKTR